MQRIFTIILLPSILFKCPKDLYIARENWKFSNEYTPDKEPDICPEWEIKSQNEDNVNYEVHLKANENSNEIASLSDYEFDMPTIRVFALTNTKIESLPKDMFAQLKNLLELDLSFNRLKKIEQGTFNYMASLRELKLGNNQLEAIPHGLFAFMEELQVLSLENNKLAKIDSTNFTSFKKLIELYLNKNKLTSFPKGSLAPFLHSLTKLDLSDNSISSLEKGFLVGWQKLGVFRVAGNPLTDINFLQELSTFLMTENGSSLKKSLKTLSLSTSHLTKENLSPDTFSVFQQLPVTELEIEFKEENAVNLTPEILGPLDRLTTLSLKIDSFYNEKLLTTFSKLKKLNLSGNNLTELPESIFDSLVNLEELDLSLNFLRSLTKRHFVKLTRLRVLNLSYNRLTFIEDDIFYAVKNSLETLDLTNNFLVEVNQTAFISVFKDRRGAQRLKNFLLAPNAFRCYPLVFSADYFKVTNTEDIEEDLRWLAEAENKTLPYKKEKISYKESAGVPAAGVCTVCPPGQYAVQYENKGNDCSLCKEGAFCPVSGLKPSTLSFCPKKMWSNKGTVTEKGCFPCPEGFICLGKGIKKSCEEGAVALGGSDVCQVCLPGYKPNAARSACEKCLPGTYGLDGKECIPCQAGSFGASVGNKTAQCDGLCEPGHYCPSGSISPKEKKCPPGSYGDIRGLKTSACSDLCEPGHFCPEGSVSPIEKKCKAGYFGSSLGNKTPDCDGKCSPNYFCAEGSTRFSEAVCPKGKQSKAGAAECIFCDEGQYSLDTNSCVGCGGSDYMRTSSLAKTVVDLYAQLQCPGCTLGEWNYHYITKESSKVVTNCLLCRNGTYNTKKKQTSPLDCKKCPYNTYSTKKGLRAREECTQCPKGSWNGNLGANSPDFCLHCPEGYFFEKNRVKFGAKIQDVCVKCPIGTYSNKNTEGCVKCGWGYFGTEEGETQNCKQLCESKRICPEGSYKRTGMRFPQKNTFYDFSWGLGLVALLFLDGFVIHHLFNNI